MCVYVCVCVDVCVDVCVCVCVYLEQVFSLNIFLDLVEIAPLNIVLAKPGYNTYLPRTHSYVCTYTNAHTEREKWERE